MLNIYNLKKYPIRLSLPKGVDTASIEQPLSKSKSGTFIMEIWKDIKEYEGYYQVSNQGRVRSGNRQVNRVNSKPYFKPGRILRSADNGGGYGKVHLHLGNANCRVYIHRLVAMMFIPNPEGKPEVNHIDGNSKNNIADNLQWVTHRENMKHAVESGLFDVKGEKHWKSRLKEKDIINIRKMYKTGKYNYCQLARKYGVADTCIGSIIRRITWTHI